MANQLDLPEFGYFINDDGSLGERVELTDDIEDRFDKYTLANIAIIDEKTGEHYRPWRFASTNPQVTDDGSGVVRIKF